MDSEVLISICIPTYNRGEILAKSLDAYVNDPAFDNSVEIVISDNFSSDCTEELITKYSKQYRNIKYKRLHRNIGADLNMSIALSLGKGLYLKLMNDTVTLNPDMLRYMLDIISLRKIYMNPIFFYQNISFLNSNKIIRLSNLNELVSNVSFNIGWIANFGIWRRNFELLENKDRLAHLQFVQVDWTIRVINENTSCNIYFGEYYSVSDLKYKGGYNVFQTFGINYLSIYDEYLKTRQLNKKTYNTEKYRLMRFFLLGLYRKLVLSRDENLIFEKDNAIKLLMKNYQYHSYFYIGIMYSRILQVLEKIKKATIFKNVN